MKMAIDSALCRKASGLDCNLMLGLSYYVRECHLNEATVF